MNNKDFCTELKKLRKKAGFTQEKLATLSGVSKIYINLLENGKRNPSDKIIAEISKALNIDENRLFVTIGKVKMDLFSTISTDKENAPDLLTKLSDEEWNEILNYIAYIKVKNILKVEQ